MQAFQNDSYVTLRGDIPELGLRGGEVGVLRRHDLTPADGHRFAVEFHHPGANCPIRAYLPPDRIEPAFQEAPPEPAPSDPRPRVALTPPPRRVRIPARSTGRLVEV